MSAPEEVEAAAFRCQRCGAPLEVTPDTIVAVCPYCGYPNWTAQAYIYPMVLVPAQARRAPEFFKRYVESDPDMRKLASQVKLRRYEIVYVPFYFADVETSGDYFGVADVVMTRVVVRRRGKETYVETQTRVVRVTVTGSYRHEHTIDIAAKRGVDSTILDALAEYYLDSRPPATPIAQVNWEDVKGTVLAAEIPADEAGTIARDEACDTSQRIVEEEMGDKARKEAVRRAPGWTPTKVTWLARRIPCRATLKSLSPITLVPYIEYTYTYRGARYRLALAGWDGGKLVAEEPITTGERIASAAGAVAAAGFLGGGGIAALLASNSALAAALGLLAFIAGAFANYKLASYAVSEARVEKGVEEEARVRKLE